MLEPSTAALSEPSGDRLAASRENSSAEDVPTGWVQINGSGASNHKMDFAWLTSRLNAAVPMITQLAGRAVARIDLLITDDRRMAQLHERHLGENRTTDVLTFSSCAASATNREAIEADIAICADEAARRSAELGHSIERELLLYAIHGLLHCAGFDDRDEAGYSRMHVEEDRILEAIGVGATFAKPDRTAGGGAA
jgi:probable rRNA maturation factor